MALRLPTRIPIRVRTAAALSIPLVLLMVVAGLEITQSGHDVADVREQSELATASIGPAGAINALMTERNYTSLWLFGVEASVDLHVDSLEDARDRTDASLAAFEREVHRRGGRAERIYGPAIEALDALEENRAEVDAYDGERNPTVENESGDHVWAIYNRLVSKLAAANRELAHQVEDDQLRQGVQLVDMAARQVDKISKIVRLATISAVRVRGPITDRTDFGRLVRMMSEADRHHESILDLTTGPYAGLAQELREESEATGIFGIEQRFAESGEVDIAGLLRGVSIDSDESYYGFIHDVSSIVQDRADDLDAAATANQRRIVILCGLLLVAAAAATLVVARSITRPLRSLTRQARDMATRRLPEAVREVHELPLGQDVVVPALEPVVVTSRDEVGDVADQLNAVQMAALDLAVEQAVMRRNFSDVFVNLCRRIQSLLGRQLELISDLTSGADTPDGPPSAARGRRRGVRPAPDLTEVSRYAIRLRRHAESLLVLAGVEPRPTPGGPAPLDDVVRAALDEVSGADRVRVVRIEPVVVAGPAVADLAHLLAELVESALREIFPEETVDLAGVAGASGYTLSIVDPGSGMAEDEIERANRRLAGEEADTTAPSKYLGQYVAARLAARHGISVTLQGTMTSGVTAAVHLPPSLLAPEPPAVAPPAGEEESDAPGAERSPAEAGAPDAERHTERPAEEVDARRRSADGEAAKQFAAAVRAATDGLTIPASDAVPPAPPPGSTGELMEGIPADTNDADAPDATTEEAPAADPTQPAAEDTAGTPPDVTAAAAAAADHPVADADADGDARTAAAVSAVADGAGASGVAERPGADDDAGVAAGVSSAEADGDAEIDGDTAKGVFVAGAEPGSGGGLEGVSATGADGRADADGEFDGSRGAAEGASAADANGHADGDAAIDGDAEIDGRGGGEASVSPAGGDGEADGRRRVGEGGSAVDVNGQGDHGAGGRGRNGVDSSDHDEHGDDVDAEAAELAKHVGNDPHPSGPNGVVTAGDDVDVYSLLSDFPDGVERPALATPTARRNPPGDAPSERPAQ